jgi:hypothetical protein
MNRLKYLINFFKEKEKDFSTQQLLFALEDGAFLNEFCTDNDQENIEIIYDYYFKKLKKEGKNE